MPGITKTAATHDRKMTMIDQTAEKGITSSSAVIADYFDRLREYGYKNRRTAMRALLRLRPQMTPKEQDNGELLLNKYYPTQKSTVTPQHEAKATEPAMNTKALMTFEFHGDNLEVVERNGEYFAVMARMCEPLGLDPVSQWQKLEKCRWATTAIITVVAEDGKQREQRCLSIRSVNMWLATIHESKVKPEHREALVRYQRECADALVDHFLGKRSHTNAVEPVEHQEPVNDSNSDNMLTYRAPNGAVLEARGEKVVAQLLTLVFGKDAEPTAPMAPQSSTNTVQVPDEYLATSDAGFFYAPPPPEHHDAFTLLQLWVTLPPNLHPSNVQSFQNNTARAYADYRDASGPLKMISFQFALNGKPYRTGCYHEVHDFDIILTGLARSLKKGFFGGDPAQIMFTQQGRLAANAHTYWRHQTNSSTSPEAIELWRHLINT